MLAFQAEKNSVNGYRKKKNFMLFMVNFRVAVNGYRIADCFRNELNPKSEIQNPKLPGITSQFYVRTRCPMVRPRFNLAHGEVGGGILPIDVFGSDLLPARLRACERRLIWISERYI